MTLSTEILIKVLKNLTTTRKTYFPRQSEMDKPAKGPPWIYMAQPSGMERWSPTRHRKDTSESQHNDEDDDKRPQLDASRTTRARFLKSESCPFNEGEKAITKSDENESKSEIQKPRSSSHQAWSKQVDNMDDSKQANGQPRRQQQHERNTAIAAIKFTRRKQKVQLEITDEHEIEQADNELQVQVERQSWRMSKPQQR